MPHCSLYNYTVQQQQKIDETIISYRYFSCRLRMCCPLFPSASIFCKLQLNYAGTSTNLKLVFVNKNPWKCKYSQDSFCYMYELVALKKNCIKLIYNAILFISDIRLVIRTNFVFLAHVVSAV